MVKQHHYRATIHWTGNKGEGTSHYRAYDRSHTISINDKPDLLGSSDPAYRGDNTRHNPEDLFLSSLSACHMLWYLHLCAEAGVVVTGYRDQAISVMTETADGGGHFTMVRLNPEVTVTDSSMVAKAEELHNKANQLCFLANSVNFPVLHYPTIRIQAKE